MDTEIIVIGKAHQNTLGIIRSLGEQGYMVNYVSEDIKNNYVKKSKYIKKVFLVGDIISCLLNCFCNKETVYILFPSDDEMTSFIDKNMDKWPINFFVPNINRQQGKINEYMDKKVMTQLAQNAGYNIPKTKKVNLSNYSIGEMEKLVNYPYIVKPLKSINGTKKNIVIVNDKKELDDVLLKLKKDYQEILIQEYIQMDKEIGVVGCVLPYSKKIIAPIVIEKIRQSVIARGSTTYGKVVRNIGYIDINKLEMFLKELDFVGIFDIEFLLSDNQLYFIEINFRNGAYGYATTKAGCNLPVHIVKDICEKGVQVTDNIHEMIFMNEVTDIRNIFESVNIFKWLSQFMKTDVFMFINKADIKPFIYKIIYSIKKEK